MRIVEVDDGNGGWKFVSQDNGQSAATAGGRDFQFNPGGTGNFGIGVVPSTRFHVKSADNATNTTLAIDATQANITASDKYVSFTSTDGEEANVVGTAVAGVMAYNTFTGSHWSQSDTIKQCPIKLASGADEIDAYAATLIPGTVLVSIDALCGWGKQQSATLPKCKVSDTKEDKAVYGVYGGHDNEGDIYVLAMGTCIALVNTEGGNIEVGDFLCTSNTPGQAMKYTGTDMQVVLGKARQSFSQAAASTIAVTLLAG